MLAAHQLIVCDPTIQLYSLSPHLSTLVLNPAPLTLDGKTTAAQRQVYTCPPTHPRLSFSHTYTHPPGYLAKRSWEMPVTTAQKVALCSLIAGVQWNISVIFHHVFFLMCTYTYFLLAKCSVTYIYLREDTSVYLLSVLQYCIYR